MSDIIHLLPDHVANQIAAGEVIQRPASVVKELLENSVDSGATQIELIIKDSGKTLIQVVDNGKGMSFSDARLCFERHATSKINSADDLFSLKTKGFRGEALASIAAIAHVELKTKQAEQEIGTLVAIEGTQITEHVPTVTSDGTSVAVKNLFYNVPARRNFLKSDSVEFSHIEEEFFRIALIHPELGFTFSHNDKLLLQLTPSNFKIRIIQIFGNHIKDKLFPIEQEVGETKINGFIAKPENAKKRKNDQYLFVNKRFITHYYLRHAIESAYKEMIPEGYKPAFFVHLQVDPKTIDVNISPTKVEAKFQDDKLLYGLIHATVKKSLGTLSLTPRIDFDVEGGKEIPILKPNTEITPPSVSFNPDYNPFQSKKNSSGSHTTSSSFSSNHPKGSEHFDSWSQFMKNIKDEHIEITPQEGYKAELIFNEPPPEKIPIISNEEIPAFLFSNQYIVALINSQVTIIHINFARERILYEKYFDALENQPIVIQHSLFPDHIRFTPAQIEIINEMKPDLLHLGYEIEILDSTTIVVNGTPNSEENDDLQTLITYLIESYKASQMGRNSNRNKTIALSMARHKKHRFKELTTNEEIQELIKTLFSTLVPHTSPSGKRILYTLSESVISQFFEN